MMSLGQATLLSFWGRVSMPHTRVLATWLSLLANHQNFSPSASWLRGFHRRPQNWLHLCRASGQLASVQ